MRLATKPSVYCGWRQNGCFYGAHTHRHFASMVRDAKNQPRGLEQNIVLVPTGDHKREIDTVFYHGGCLYPDSMWSREIRSSRRVLGQNLGARDG